jgi:hypothetical protein
MIMYYRPKCLYIFIIYGIAEYKQLATVTRLTVYHTLSAYRGKSWGKSWWEIAGEKLAHPNIGGVNGTSHRRLAVKS